MTHGKKQQEVCQSKKNKKSMTGLRTMLLVAIAIIFLVIVTILTVRNIKNANKNTYDIFIDQRFVFVQDPELVKEYGKDYGAGFDLREKEYFYFNRRAVKNNVLYGTSFNASSPKDIYQRALQEEISSAITKLKISPKSIRKQDFQVVRSTESLVSKKYLDDKYPPQLEEQFLISENKFSKVRITYNKRFLPIKIEWYYDGEDGLRWYISRMFSYPYKNKQDFNKALDEAIEWIKISESEMEEEE